MRAPETEIASRPAYLLARVGKREEAKRRVESVTLMMFATRGFHAVTVEDICAGARISPATFYRYFGSKEGAVRQGEGLLAAARGVSASVYPQAAPTQQFIQLLKHCAGVLEGQDLVGALADEVVQNNDDLRQRSFVAQRHVEDASAEAPAVTRHETGPFFSRR